MTNDEINKQLKSVLIKWLDGKTKEQIADKIISIVDDTVMKSHVLVRNQVRNKIIAGFQKHLPEIFK